MSERTGSLEPQNSVAGNAGDTISDGSTIYFDPGSVGSANGNEGGRTDTGNVGPDDGSSSPKRRRGRPPGSGKKSGTDTKAEASDNLTPKRALEAEGISAILLSMHTMMASFTKVPELEIAPDEANKLGAAMADVSRQYNVKATEKTLAWTHLATTCAMVYGTRVFAYKMRKDMEKKEAEDKGKNVVPHPAMNMGIR